ncbi:lipocalin family protein [Thioclava atlantica]|nr:lipocalin family protein [Thioclava atlantica]
MPAALTPLRSPEARISSAALFEPERFAGDWHVVQSGVAGCSGAQHWTWDGQGAYQVSGTDCAGAQKPLDDRVVLTGPGGRLAARRAYEGEPIFVLWVDQDYRIAALGTPSGRWGVILSRQSPARPDLLSAAREVMDFNGYDLARLQ